MNKLIADKWVKALRSGEYKQTQNMLEDNNSFCCLGVLCKLGQAEGIDVILRPEIARRNSRLLGESLHYQPSIKAWSGICHDPDVELIRRSDLALNTLISLNDKEKYTFNQIADVIEQTWEQL